MLHSNMILNVAEFFSWQSFSYEFIINHHQSMYRCLKPTFVNDDEKLKGSGNQRPPTRYAVFSLSIVQGRLFNQFFKYHGTRCTPALEFSLFFNII